MTGFQLYVTTVLHALKKKCTWKGPGSVFENIQHQQDQRAELSKQVLGKYQKYQSLAILKNKSPFRAD